MKRYRATEYNPGMDGSVTARIMSQIDIPRQLLRDVAEGQDVRSGLVNGQETEDRAAGQSVVTIIWGQTVWGDGTRAVLAWYEMDAREAVSASQ